MTYTHNLRTWAAEMERVHHALTTLDDELLEHRDREKRLAALNRETETDLATKYGMDN